MDALIEKGIAPPVEWNSNMFSHVGPPRITPEGMACFGCEHKMLLEAMQKETHMM